MIIVLILVFCHLLFSPGNSGSAGSGEVGAIEGALSNTGSTVTRPLPVRTQRVTHSLALDCLGQGCQAPETIWASAALAGSRDTPFPA